MVIMCQVLPQCELTVKKCILSSGVCTLFWIRYAGHSGTVCNVGWNIHLRIPLRLPIGSSVIGWLIPRNCAYCAV